MKVKALYLNLLLLVFGCKLAAQPIPALYGTSSDGGQYGFGGIFKTNYFNSSGLDHYGITQIWAFDSINGKRPEEIILGTDGMLYGYTSYGGHKNIGTVFKFNPSNNQHSVLHSFDTIDGIFPKALIYGNDGYLYGLACNGGQNWRGTLFKINILTHNFTKLHDFYNENSNQVIGGVYPCNLIKASNGKLYGVSSTGGMLDMSGMGFLFSYDPVTNAYDKLHVFLGSERVQSPRKIIQATNTKLYGVTGFGGGIFSYDVNTSTYTLLMDSVYIKDRLMQADNGLLYGINRTGNSLLVSINLTNDSVKYHPSVTSHSALSSNHIQGSDYKLYGTEADDFFISAGSLYSADIYNGYAMHEFFTFGGHSSGLLNPNCLIEIPPINCDAYFQIYPDPSITGLCRGYNLSTGNNLSYSWQFGDGYSSPDPYPHHVYAQPGLYRVCLTITGQGGCTDFFCDTTYAYKTDAGTLMSELIIAASPTNIDQYINDTGIEIYPNPTQNVLHIVAGSLQIEEVIVYNVQGQIVNHTKNPGANKLDVSQLMSGTYLIELKTLNASIKKRWVKL